MSLPTGPSAPLLTQARDTLTRWSAPSPEQEGLRAAYLDHLAAHPDGLWRSGPPVHLTASCFVLDPEGTRTLLSLHRKGRFWVQFGGHLEQGDTSLRAAALREATEESGLPSDELSLLTDDPIDLDRHRLSSSFGRCQEHLDVAYLAVASPADATTVSAESLDVAWWPVSALPPGIVPDLPVRLARAAAAVRAGR